MGFNKLRILWSAKYGFIFAVAYIILNVLLTAYFGQNRYFTADYPRYLSAAFNWSEDFPPFAPSFVIGFANNLVLTALAISWAGIYSDYANFSSRHPYLPDLPWILLFSIMVSYLLSPMTGISGFLSPTPPAYGAGTSIIAFSVFWYYAFIALCDYLKMSRFAPCKKRIVSFLTLAIFFGFGGGHFYNNLYHYIGGGLVLVLACIYFVLMKSQSRKHIISQ